MLKQPVNGNPIITRGFTGIHTGIDYAVEHRTAIIATADGVVSKLNNTETRNWLANTPSDPFKKGVGKVIYYRPLTTADYGKFVKIDHGNGVSTLYAHLDEVLVYEGQSVKEGELIAYSDNTGNSTGDHLHYEYRIKDRCVDPATADLSFKGDSGKGINIVQCKGNVKITVPTLYVRSGPSRSYPLKGDKELHKGDTVTYNGYVEGESIDGNKFWYLSAKGNYFWSGGTDSPDPLLLVVDTNKDMTQLEHDEKLKYFDGEKARIEARKAELEAAMVQNQEEAEKFKTEWEAFAAEPIESDQVEEAPVEEAPVAEQPVEEVPAEPDPVMDAVDQSQEDEIKSLKAELEALRAKVAEKLGL